ncbi:MAG: 23S rRNA methyltransferase [Micromonosporaceae bacterium]|nr:23S rRNA methyltransferase [Micromonosporaceae bacterium]
MNSGGLGLNNGAVSALRCPCCGQSLDTDQTGLHCPIGHRFDLARQGYIDLSGGRVTHGGDTAGMVAERMALLGSGHLSVITDAIVEMTEVGAAGLAVDVGAGTGHHLTELLRARPGLSGLAVDISKAALRRAGRAHPRLVAVRADVWRGLPLASDTARLILNVFAPRSPAEFHRVLRADGQVLVVTPTEAHLCELVEALGLISVDPRKRTRLAGAMAPLFTADTTREHTARVRLPQQAVRSLVLMGPSAWHLDQQALTRKLAQLPDPVSVTISVNVDRWRPTRPVA